ncbi:peptidoglycan glycosyltransferase [Amylibacter ulvae]|uniref:Peptidoglycan glycosyltransferase n=1 Tax=Paramylibacter ulvae TaxID=1651968 RepID=A0ABQ3CXC6_9RHOB|nr:penicillin-binding protein 2 [Amylibacter ulvae]GHA45637.1 peptidoglycan glycosyltransferase [Amylibacter ulvae]
MMEFDHKGDIKRSRLSRRALMLGGIQTAVAGVIGWRMHQLGVKEGDQYRLLAEENRINIQLLPPARGLIYDRDGDLLTINDRVYAIEMVREQSRDPELILNRLAQLLPLTQDDIDKALADMKKRRAFVPVTVATGLEWEHIAAVSANAPALPGVTPVLGLNRQYPKGPEFSHIVGYVGSVSDYDLNETDDHDPLLRIPRFKIGKTGIEATLEKPLRGEAGIKRIEVNSLGRVIRELDRKEGASGVDIQLTVGQELQTYTLNRLKGHSASAVVMDVTNGDILALASGPTFDSNKFLKPISQADWKDMNDPHYRPLVNKAVAGTYPPGSTFKMVVALAALDAGVVDAAEEVYCPGHMEVAKRKFHCWKRGGHGHVHLREALRYSCDVYFYDLALRVGIEKITLMAHKLGLGERPNIQLPSIKEGLMPTKDWKRKVKKKDWVLGDSINAGIGQGFVLASPLQLAVMTARIASGMKIEPRLINLYNNELYPTRGLEPLDINPAHLELVRRGMYEVSNHRRGTAYGARLKEDRGGPMAGKTGTSQVRQITAAERRKGVVRNEDLPWNRRDHALFVAFAPAANPRYAISVVVEHGGGGSAVAAPIARDIMARTIKLGDKGYGNLPNTRTREQT